MPRVKPKIITVDENGFINIDQFVDIIDISIVKYYQITVNIIDNSMLIEFFDKDENAIRPNLPLT